MSGPEIDSTRLSRDHTDRSSQESAAIKAVLLGIDRGLHDAAGARHILESLGLIVPLHVPKRRRKYSA